MVTSKSLKRALKSICHVHRFNDFKLFSTILMILGLDSTFFRDSGKYEVQGPQNCPRNSSKANSWTVLRSKDFAMSKISVRSIEVAYLSKVKAPWIG